MNANTPGKVAIFWDLDTCTPTYNSAGYHLVDNIRRIALNFGHVTLFKAYLEIDYAHPAFAVRSLELRTELQASGVSLTDCPSNSSCNILNQMLSVDLVLYATDHAGPQTTILLISGNRGLAYALSSLRLRNHQVVLVCPSNTDPALLAQVTARYDWNAEVLGKNTSVNPTPERAPSARPSARSRAFSTTTNGYSAPGSRRAYTANETVDVDDSEDDFYMNDPTIFNNTTPFTNTTLNGPTRRSESPSPWSGGPPFNPLRPRSDSRAFSPAMSFRSAKTSILTTPPSGPVALPADAGVQRAPVVNGHAAEETNGPADPIEPMFSASPEPIVPKKPAVVNNPSNAAQSTPATQPITPPPKVPDPIIAAPAPQLATPNTSNEFAGEEVAPKTVPAGIFNSHFFPSQLSTAGQGSTTTPAPAPVQAATSPFASPTPATAPVSAAPPATSKAPAPVAPAINGAPVTAASSKPVPSTPAPAPAPVPTAKPATSTPAPVAKPVPSTPAPVAKPATSTPAPAPAAKPITPAPAPASPPAKTPKKKKSTNLSTSAPAFVAAGPSTPQPSPPKAVAAHWRVLIDILEHQRRTQGQTQIGRSIVGTELAKHKPKAIYEAANTSSFPAWIKKAEEDGIVETGGHGNNQWIALRPEWRSNSVLV